MKTSRVVSKRLSTEILHGLPVFTSPEQLATDVDALIADLRMSARTAAEASRAESTERAYASDWRDFSAFVRRIDRVRHPAEPETIALYVADLARRGRKSATIARRLAAIAVYHRAAGYPSPTEHDIVRSVVRGLRRQLGLGQRQKSALELDPLRSVVATISGDPRGLRDRALLLIGWVAALRRSELAALRVGDLEFEDEGLVLRMRRSKTDQEAAGDAVAIPRGREETTCPVRALKTWIDKLDNDGHVFRKIDRHGNIGDRLTPASIAAIVQKRVHGAGLTGDYAGHSLRAGFATTAARVGRTEASIMRHGRWKSVITARRYIRYGSRWVNNPADDIGL